MKMAKPIEFIRRFSLFLLFASGSFFCLTSTANAEKSYGDLHHAVFVEGLDAQTVLLKIPGIHPLLGDKIPVTIRGIDTPDLYAACSKERELAARARDIIAWQLQRAKQITLKNVSRGRSFQIVATVLADGKDIRESLVKTGAAVWQNRINGKKDWCR